MTDLDKLIEAVEGGWWYGDTTSFFDHRGHMNCYEAFNGSLDAAKALHEALLDSGFHAEIWASCTRPQVKVVRQDDEYIGYDDIPARAWLIAVLKAYREVGK